MFRIAWVSFTAVSLQAQPDLFERKIRPVLAEKCFACHNSRMKAPMGGLALDTKSGLAKVVTAGQPGQSRILTALRYTDSRFQMPPAGKLTAAVIRDFEQWIAAGAADPRQPDNAAAAPAQALSIDQARSWWAFQPVREYPAPKQSPWVRTKIDAFLLAQLEQNNLRPGPRADSRTLARRLYLDMWGLAPTHAEIEAFAANPDYPALVEKLLASPHYGERWGRYWLDVARYAEDNPTSEATNPPYTLAWRYRDWVIEAVNKDVPYPQFVKLQLAADQLGAPREDLRALGYLGAGPIYHKDARLSKEVIETLATDDWDERVDAVSRGLLGLTVACARCHDHKFDPILTRDYYSLASVFASTSAVARPLRPIDPKLEQRFLFLQQRLFHLDYLAKLLTGEPGTKPEESARKVVRYRAEIQKLKEEIAAFGPENKDLADFLTGYGTEQTRTRGAETQVSSLPFTQAVYDAGLWIDGDDPDITYMDYRPGTPRDLPVFLRGSVVSPGDPAPRRFLTALARSDPDFRNGSGRAELADRIFSDAAPLAARVMVNRVWAWHFGKPLAATASDFGTQGEKPSHPELLDDLTARFIANGWSLKWLHREILLSSAYQQDSKPRPDADRADPTNRWLWRMNPRRLDIEAFRDSILRAVGSLEESLYGPPKDLDDARNNRRTVYARVSRGRLNTLFRLYDFSDPSQHSPAREFTTTALQQLFVLNSRFLQDQSAVLAKRAGSPLEGADAIRAMYRSVLSRDPSAKELDLAASFLRDGSAAQLAQALLATNEFIFWP